MEIVLKLESLYEFVGVLIKQKSSHKLLRLQLRSFKSSFKDFSVSEIGQCAPSNVGLLDVLVDMHTFKSHIQVKRSKARFRSTEILRIIHTIIHLLLVPVEI